jgi:hypothetical protein
MVHSLLLHITKRSEELQVTLRIENYADGRKTVIRLSGRLQSTHLDELNTQIEGAQSRIALDLSGVVLVDVEVVRFLNGCEESGVELLHCRPYIREWMVREKDGEG